MKLVKSNIYKYNKNGKSYLVRVGKSRGALTEIRFPKRGYSLGQTRNISRVRGQAAARATFAMVD